MAEGESAEKEAVAAAAKAAEPASLGSTVKKTYAAVAAICGVLAAIAVFTAAYGKSGTSLLVTTAVAFVVLMIVAVAAAFVYQYRSRRFTATAWKLASAAALAVVIGAAAGFLLSNVGLKSSPGNGAGATAGPTPSVPVVAPTTVAATSAEPPAAPTSAAAQAPNASCTNGADAVPIVPAGGTEFNIQIEVCTPAPAGRHYWLTVVLHNQGSGKTTNYYPLGDVATLLTMPDASGRLVPYFASKIPNISSTRCWQVLMTPDSMQQDLVNQDETGQYLYTNGSRPPAGATFASPCVAEPE